MPSFPNFPKVTLPKGPTSYNFGPFGGGIGPLTSTVPALQGLTVGIKPPNLPLPSIARPVSGFSKPPTVSQMTSSASAIQGTIDPFLNQAKDVLKTVADYKLEFAKIKAASKSVFGKDNESSGSAAAPTSFSSSTPSAPQSTPTTSGGLNGTTILLIGGAIVLLVLLVRR